MPKESLPPDAQRLSLQLIPSEHKIEAYTAQGLITVHGPITHESVAARDRVLHKPTLRCVLSGKLWPPD
jgi:hypothetical protein